GGGDLQPPKATNAATSAVVVLRSHILVDSVLEAKVLNGIGERSVDTPLPPRPIQKTAPVHLALGGCDGRWIDRPVEPVGGQGAIDTVADVIRAPRSWRVAAVGHRRLACAADG